MNSNHLQQIFTNYIERFEELNNPVHREYYKWQIAKKFHEKGDYNRRRALNWVADAAEKYLETPEWKNAEVHCLS